jgi:hypothetical protein
MDRTTWCHVGIKERQMAFKSLYIEHEDVVQVETIMANKLQEIDDADVDVDCERYYDTPNTLGSGMMVIGESGTGKTAFADRVIARHPRVVTANQTFIPAVYMRVPSTVTPKGMGKALLTALKDPNPNGKAIDLLHRCVLLMRKCRVRILIIDDFQDIPARRSKGIAEIGDWIRTLIDATPTLVIAMGTPIASVVRDSSDQVRKRIQATAHLLPFLVPLTDAGKWEEQKDNLRKWSLLLGSIDKELPLAKSSNLMDPETAILLLRASNGGFSHLKKILWHAISHAVNGGSESIEREHLREAFKSTFGDAAKKGNPFDPSYDGEPLIRPGQAFFVHASGAK